LTRFSDSEDDDDAGPDPNGDDLSAMDAELSQLLKGLTGGGDDPVLHKEKRA
jgi:hypothetical protein